MMHPSPSGRFCSMRSALTLKCADLLIGSAHKYSATLSFCKQSNFVYYPCFGAVLASGDQDVALPCRQLRQHSSLNTGPAGGSGVSSVFTLGEDNTGDEAAAALQAFTQQIGQTQTREILSVAKQVAKWRTRDAATHARGAMSGHVPVAVFAQQAAALLLQRKQKRGATSIQGTIEAFLASTGLAEILHDPQCPALPFAARQASARSQSGGPDAACLEVLNYITTMQSILERQLNTANSNVCSTNMLTNKLTALQANLQALNAVAAAPGAPASDVSRQLKKCTRLVMSHVESIPKEEPLSTTEPALRTIQAQDRRVLILVITALEAMQNCEYPACSSLSAKLMLAAISQLQRTTKAQVHMHGVLVPPSLMSSFICSLIVLFSKKPDVIRDSLAGQFRPVTRLKIAEHSKAGRQDLVGNRGELRNARVLAANCLHRILGRWITQVSAGTVELKDMCAVMQVLHASKEATELEAELVPKHSVQVVASSFCDRVRAAVCADVVRRFNDDSEQTRFHAWQYAVVMRAATVRVVAPTIAANGKHVQNALCTFVQSAADLAADDMESVGHSWRIQDLSAVLCAAATHQVSAHRTFSVAAILCQTRLQEMAVRASVEDAAMLPQLESLVWAFAVTRRHYPYSADAVCRAAADVLQELLAAQPHAVDTAVVADMLWSFAAMWQTPVGLFELVGTVLDDRRRTTQKPLRSDIAESLAWSFTRAAVRLPACVLESAPNRFTDAI